MDESFSSWNASSSFPYFVAPEGSQSPETLDLSTLTTSMVYNWVSDYENGSVSTSQYSSQYDWNQAFFRLAMLDDKDVSEVPYGAKVAWSEQAESYFANLTYVYEICDCDCMKYVAVWNM